MGLPALLRNFLAARRKVICRAASLAPLAGLSTGPRGRGERAAKGEDRLGPGRFASRQDEAEKTDKTNPSFRRAKRSVSQACRKPLESLWGRNQGFRGIVCFQRLGSVFVSPFFRAVYFQRLDSPLRFAGLLLRETPWFPNNGNDLRRFRICQELVRRGGDRAAERSRVAKGLPQPAAPGQAGSAGGRDPA